MPCIHPSPRSRRIPRLALALAALPLAACGHTAVEWEDGTRELAEPAAVADTSAASAARSPLARLALEPAGAARLVVAPRPETSPAAADPAACAGSLRAAPAAGAEWHAVWWSRRPDSSVVLRAARSDDGGRSWGAPVPVDARDQGRIGCDRPVPDVVADTASGYVHVAYWLTAPEGPGVFFSHSMERGAMYHAPVAITYGARPAAASIAAWRDTVAVLHEDANADRAPLGLALSRTSGHIFEERLVVPAAGDGMVEPLVALHGDRVAIAWRGTPRLDAGVQPESRGAVHRGATASGPRVARVGRVADLRGRSE